MPDPVRRAKDLVAIALDNRANAAAVVALGENAPPSDIGAYVLGFKCAAAGEPEPQMDGARERRCCRQGYERGQHEQVRERRSLFENGMRLRSADGAA